MNVICEEKHLCTYALGIYATSEATMSSSKTKDTC